MAKKSLVVNIAGQRFSIRSDADEAYVQALAEYVDERLDEVHQGSRMVAPHRQAILAALNIADELFQERQGRDTLKQQVRKRSRAIMAFLDQEVIRRQQQQ